MLDQGQDQAAGLRRLLGGTPLSLMAFPLANDGDERWIPRVAHALRGLGARPVVMDASRGRLVQAFGLRPRYELLDLLQGQRTFDAVAQSTRDGIYVMRADKGLDAFVASGGSSRELFSGFARLSHGFDALMLAMPAHELACLANPEAVVPVLALDSSDASITRAYATIKQLARDFGYRRFSAMVQPLPGGSARGAHARLAMVARSFLDVEVALAGCLPLDGAQGAALAELAQNLLHTAATPLTLH